jgi:dienelactone hydrolase
VTGAWTGPPVWQGSAGWQVVLFHHAQGLAPGVVAFADQLRGVGHTVHTPDLFDGRTFDSIQAGMAHVEEVGFPEIIQRGARAVQDLPAEVVYAGFSLGVVPAQMLAQTRPGGPRRPLLLVPAPSRSSARPGGRRPVQVHGMDADPIFVAEGDLDAARMLVPQAKDGEVFLYADDAHYFPDSSLPSYDPEATMLLTRRVLDVLAAHT